MTSRKTEKQRQPKSDDEKYPLGREMSPALFHVLNHPVRRQILRLLDDGQVGRSPSEMGESIDRGLPALGFHARALCACGIIRQTRTRRLRGSTERFYASNVSEDEHVATILWGAEDDDAFLGG